MVGYEHFEQKNSAEHIREKMDLIKQWIPVTEKSSPDVPDEALRISFNERINAIKAEFTELSNVDFNNDEVIQKVNNLYKRAETLLGEVGIYFQERGEEEKGAQ